MVSREKINRWGLSTIVLLLVQLLSSLCITAIASSTDGTRIRIHRYSEFALPAIEDAQLRNHQVAKLKVATPRAVTQWTLDLQTNAQLNHELLNKLPDGGISLLRGAIAGKPGSWVRLTRTVNGTHGLIWDGKEMYAIEPSAEVRTALAVSLPTPTSDTVIFKLADTTVDLGAEYCGAADHGPMADHSGMATYQALAAEMDQTISATGTNPTLILELQALADAAFRAQYSSDQAALDAIMVRLNNVDGIFSAQIGLSVVATDVEIHGGDSFGLSDSTVPGTLLDSLGQLRNNVPTMRTYGATHLFTGRDLDGDTLGIAYIGNVCGARYAASLSEIRNRGAWIDSLVAAHELGHQLGAVHDGTGVCGGTATQSYLMGSQINGSSELSQCSRESILATMQYASCLVPVGPPDMTIGAATAQPRVKPRETLLWPITVENIGTGRASTLNIHIEVPAQVTVDSASINGGACTPQADGRSVDCRIDSLGALETRTLNLTLHSDQSGIYTINANVAASADDNLANNAAVFVLNVTTEPATTTVTSASATPEVSSNSSGGGGVFGLGWLAGMATLVTLRRRTRRLN